jgi:hypothetical protein
MAKEIPVVSALHDGAATSLLLGSIGILALVNLGNGLVSLVARDEAKTRSHTCPHTDGTIKSRVLLQ